MLYLQQNPELDNGSFSNFTPTDSEFTTLGCKWYQVGCIANAVIDWFDLHSKAVTAITACIGSAAAMSNALGH